MDHAMNPIPRPRTLRLLLAPVLCALAAAAEPAQAVPRPVAELLTAAAAAEPAQVVAMIDGWKGDAHPLLTLVRGQARWRLASAAADPQRQRLLTEAERDFTAVLKLDPGLRQAHLGLAQIAAARGDWTAASRAAASGIDPASADRASLAFLADTAARAGDWRLATLTAQHGIMRFPDDATLRRLELLSLRNAGRAEDARQAVLALLGRDPGDADLWRHLAWSAQETGRADEALAALEAAVAVAPDDQGLRRQLAAAQLGRGLPQAALITVRPLVGDPPAPTALRDDGLMLLAAQAAAGAGEVPQARAWLAAVPEDARSRAHRLASARFAVQAGDPAAASEALAALIAGGERDATVLTWAASLSEAQGETARAEALYLQASGSEWPAGAPAMLRLVAFYLKQGRKDEASVTLASYLARKPDDAHARSLQARLDAGGR